MGLVPNHGNTTHLNREQSAAVEAELGAILRSSWFAGSKRCQDFLEFIVRQALEGNYQYLTERFLGAELFGRPINYETGTDSIVRVRANDVRRRLAQYYSAGHGGSRVAIDLVTGTYVPEFRWIDTGESKAVESSASAPEGSVHSVSPSPAETAFAGANRDRRWVFPALIAIALALGCYLGWWTKEQAMDGFLHPMSHTPAMLALWSGFLDANRDTDIVLSDASFQLLEDIGKQPFTLNEYLNHSYVNRLQTRNPSPDIQLVLTHIASKNFGNSVEFRLAQRISALDSIGNKARIYNAREYTPALVARDSVVLIGSQYTNPWQQLFTNQLNFIENPPGVLPGAVMNKAPRPGEQASYIPTDSVGYCVVAYLPNPGRNTKVLLIEGSSAEATEAGGDFVLSEESLAAFEKTLHSGSLPYFEALLKTSQVRDTPITATVEAYRVYPSQQ